MNYRTLGSTGLSVSVVGIGTWQLGGEWGFEFTQADVNAIFARGRELGVNLIDTAECYGDHASEAYIGKALEQAGSRDEWIIATKFGHKFNKPFERSEPRKPADIRTQLEESLKALRTDRVELLQYHSWGDDTFLDDDVLAELGKLKGEGKFLHLGNSVGSNTNVKQIAASAERGIEFIQIIYNRLDRAPEETAFPICQQQSLGVLARVPLASGYLSGKYAPGHQFDKDEVRGKWHKGNERDAKLREVERIKADEYEREVDPQATDMATWALAWCLRHPAVTSVIPGAKNAGQVESNAAASGLTTEARRHGV